MKSPHGKEIFIEHYRSLFLDEKEFNAWINALSQPNAPILRFNPQNENHLEKLWAEAKFPWKTLKWYPYALLWPQGHEKNTPLPGHDEFLFYAQNPSSLLPVLALDPQPGETILDACAAPGGKTLFVAERMQKKGRLVANDRSPARRERLKKILHNYGMNDFVEIKGWDAGQLFKVLPETFDKILLDAPCSSEKHVWNSPRELSHWKPGRIRHLKKDQFRLLKNLWRCLKSGGRLVYSTCAVTPEENEQVIKKFLSKRDTAMSIPINKTWPHENGRVHPHLHPGMDPMFVTILEKTKTA